jgi:glutaconate CoA-transferase subunit B
MLVAPSDVSGPAPVTGSWSADEMMTVAAARQLVGRRACFVGIGIPSMAANLARRTYAPDLVLIYESGTIGAKPTRLPLSIGDGELAETADAVVSVPEIFNYWLQSGRIDVGFLGAGQIDRFANINTTVVGQYAHPKTRLPGAGGAPEIASSCQEVILVLRHSKRALVERVDFVTSFGHGEGYGHRARLGLRGAGPTAVITDLGMLHPDKVTGELVLTHVHPGVSPEAAVEATGWPLRVVDSLRETEPPTSAELDVLRTLRLAGGEAAA